MTATKNLTREEAAERAATITVESYDVSLDLTDADGFDSACDIRFTARHPGASTFVELDGRATRVELNGRELDPHAQVGNRIRLDGIATDNVLRVEADCSYTNTGEGLHRFVDPVDGATYLYAQSFLDDAQRLFACFDQPDLKATFRLTVRARPEWTVIGNERGSRDGDTWTFATTQRMSTYLFTVAAGPWAGTQARHDGIDLGVWCRQSLREHLEAEEIVAITRSCFDFLHETFGRRYAFGDTYDQLFVPEFNAGAMENPGAVTISEDFLFRSKVTVGRRRTRAVVIAHEMAHMWFGDLVTMRWWDDVWLNESFAELMGYHTIDRTGLYDDVWADFSTSRKAWGYQADALPTTHPVAGSAPDTRSALLDFDGISYAKGASVLRQLMAMVGEDAFFAGVRTYFDRHAFGSTSLADLLAEIETSSGRDLRGWSDAWLRTAGTSTLRAVDGVLVQQAPGASGVQREHHLGIAGFDVVDGRLWRRARQDVVLAGEAVQMPDLGGPADLVLLNDGDLTFAKIRFDDRSVATVVDSLATLDDPLARALCWGALWDALRDAEITPGAFIEAVLRNVHAEADAGVLATLLDKALIASVSYSTPERGPGRLSALAALAWTSARTAEPGGDLQLAWVTAAISASGDGDVGALAGLLDGTTVPKGLVVDADLRWLVVRRLAVLGVVSEAQIGAELERDPTTAGERHADYARAARPDPEAKAVAWASLTADPSVSNHRADALARGFWQPGQEDVLDGAVERYFAVIADMWETRSPQVAQSLAKHLFPSTVVHAYLLDRADLFLAGPLPGGLRRVVVEQHDELRRALVIRALDT
ncbi:MAG TPA: aminopeptidase N [Mycobacteriales bacterium]|nr:aminopeptidase N [Mycobacteriales bacterium]